MRSLRPLTGPSKADGSTLADLRPVRHRQTPYLVVETNAGDAPGEQTPVNVADVGHRLPHPLRR